MKKTLNTSALVTADSPKGQRATETFRAQYNKAGLTEETAQILNEHPGFAEYLLAGIRRFGAKAPDYGLAQSILGDGYRVLVDLFVSLGLGVAFYWAAAALGALACRLAGSSEP